MGSKSENKMDLGGFRVYPSLRDHPLKTATQWMNGRRIDDNIGDLWRVHDKLYDLTPFIKKHPGGPTWLEATRGTDITEAFETAHINIALSKSILSKYYVKPAECQRISPYTFHENGFFSKLRHRVHEKLSSLSQEEKLSGRQRVTKVQNILLPIFGFLFVLAGLTGSYALCIATGFALFLNINCAHNYYHQRDSWRVFAFDLSILSSYEWRITHGMSHHIFTNSILDFELSDFEPIFDFRVYPKSFIQRYIPPILYMVFPLIFFFQEGIKRIITILLGQQKLRPENLLCLSQLGLLFFLSEKPFTSWLIIHASASYFFGFMGIIAAHHHPDIYHVGDGQSLYGMDWGIAQLEAVRDRKDVNGNLLAELTIYGNHILHHLFPTLDHGLLDTIRPMFEETCKELELPDELHLPPLKQHTQWELFTGMLSQLMRTQPRSQTSKDTRKKLH